MLNTALRGLVAGAVFVIATTPALASDLDPKELLVNRGCMACHIVPGVKGPGSSMGPTLKGLSKKKRIVAGLLVNNEKNMRRWLKNPKKVKSSTMMPNIGLSDEEIDVLVAFFKTL